jgi:hypothetical protein
MGVSRLTGMNSDAINVATRGEGEDGVHPDARDAFRPGAAVAPRSIAIGTAILCSLAPTQRRCCVKNDVSLSQGITFTRS